MAGGTVIGRQGRDVRRLALALVAATLAFALALVARHPSALAGSIGQYQLEEIASFNSPVYAEDNGVNANLLFVVEQNGRIRVVKDGAKKEKPFLDIRDQVMRNGEQGLLSVAFDPDYENSGLFYVYYVTNGGDIRIDQFERGDKPTRADFGSRAKVIKVEHDQASNHNGGQLQFGPDGDLYAGTGDGGPQQDPENDAQDPDSLLGKLLRIDPQAGGGYTVPNDNPFVGGAGADEIFALGLRNPWRFSFDSANGALTIGDVGGTDWEEIDYVAGGGLGANYGWNDFEGTHETTFGIGPNASPHTPPVAEFSHGSPDGFCAIIGGYVIHDPDLVQNEYIYSDLCDNHLRLLQVPSGADGDNLDLQAPGIVSFGEGTDGQIYAVSHNGPVFALEPTT
jgi:glucose/arabinose dehydrogenase